MKKNTKRNIKFAIGILLSIFLLYLAFRRVDVATLIDSMKETNLKWLAVAVLLFMVSFFVRASLWKTLLNLDGQASILQLFKSFMIGYMGNIILPLRGGELLRVISLKKMCEISMSKSLSSIVVERVLDLLSLLVFTGILSLFMDIPTAFKSAIKLIVVISVLCSMILLYFANTPVLYKYVHWAIQFFPDKYKARGDAILKNFIMGLSALNSQFTILKIVFLSLVCWVLVYFSLYFTLIAYNLNPTWIMPLALLVILNITLTVPMPPAYIGIYPFFTVLTLGFFGIDKSVSLGFSFVLQAIDFIPSIILGITFFFQENLFEFFKKSSVTDKDAEGA